VTDGSTPKSCHVPVFDTPMPIELVVGECLNQAMEFVDLANATERPELRANYLELAAPGVFDPGARFS
jgi:hypothetical protein